MRQITRIGRNMMFTPKGEVTVEIILDSFEGQDADGRPKSRKEFRFWCSEESLAEIIKSFEEIRGQMESSYEEILEAMGGE